MVEFGKRERQNFAIREIAFQRSRVSAGGEMVSRRGRGVGRRMFLRKCGIGGNGDAGG